MALEWLHHHKFMHRDLKCENIMIDKYGHAKLIDFGVSEGQIPVLTPAIRMPLKKKELVFKDDDTIDATITETEDEEMLQHQHAGCRCHENFGRVVCSSELRGSVEYMAPEMLTED